MRMSDWSSDVCSSDLACRQPPEMCLGGGLVGKVERLRIELAGERHHLVARHLIGAEARRMADLDILEILHRSALLGRNQDGFEGGIGAVDFGVEWHPEQVAQQDRKSTRLNSSH